LGRKIEKHLTEYTKPDDACMYADEDNEDVY
jgi:hypothetical protein